MAYNQNETSRFSDERVQDINPTPVDPQPHQSWQSAYSNRNGGEPQQPPRPANHLVWAIVATVLGCGNCLPFIFGIVAIVYAAKVNKLYDAGQVAEAYNASKNAKTWCVVATVLIAVGFVASLIINLTGYNTLMLEQMHRMMGVSTY